MAKSLREYLQEQDYVLLHEIGSGSFGHVYTIYSQTYNQIFVAKAVDPTESYMDEINALRAVYHPNIINLYNYFEFDGTFYQVMEYCPGGDLRSYLKKNGPIDPRTLEIFVYDLINALAACHQAGISHNDIKPENILLDQSNRIKLADFGLSTKSTAGASTQFNGGTVPFMAPEAFHDTRYNHFKADVWSLGVTIYFLACGIMPFDDPSLLYGKDPAVNYEIIPDQKLANLLSKMIVTDPSKRLDIHSLKQDPYFKSHLPKVNVRRSSVTKPTPLTLQLKNAANAPTALRSVMAHDRIPRRVLRSFHK